MALRSRLTKRIALAFVLMTAVVAGLFSVSVKVAVDYVEIRLMSESLDRHLDSILATLDEAGGEAPHLGPDLALYRRPLDAQPDHAADLPHFLHGMQPGFHEHEVGREAWHVMVRDHGHHRYWLVLDQRDFERRENLIQLIVLAGFVACVLIAWALGSLLAHKVITPVVRLAGQVRDREQLLPLAPPLAPDYADDEVGRLAAAFDATLGRLRDALERERLFTSDVSHELRTPLMVIGGACELLQAQAAPHSPQSRQLERIARATAEMRALVETFLRLARSGPETDDLDIGTVDLVRQSRENWQEQAEARGLRFELEFDPPLDAEPDAAPYETVPRYPATLLQTVVGNLVRNAIHHTDHGFVHVRVEHQRVIVSDSGVGIPESARDKVFEPFYRGDPTRGDGVGIGLSLVRRICAHQGWRISLDAPSDGGCRFTLDLSRSLHTTTTFA